ncbi:MAG: nodulation protein NfeD [Proteobacteria bacterium]|nr:nodulation protein NfeD [Pseudomonadota bacterium]
MTQIARVRHWRQRYSSALFALFVLGSTPVAQADGTAILLDLEGAIGVTTAEFIIGGIEEAEDRGAELVIIRMDTPGGLVSPMRDIVKAILGSDVPVATYVSPGGARADSAGTYILLASHIAAMAPTTHLGAATPVALGGGWPGDKDGADDKDDSDDDEESDEKEEKNATDSGSAMDKKVMNDAIAYIRSLAEAHGRNADWAEKAVTEAATLTATEALENNVIDLIVANQAELLQKINGREIKVNDRTVVLETESIEVETLEPSWRLKVLSTIASPEVALLLLMIGIYGLLFEGYNPGAVVPAVAGVICLLLAAYALQVLPVNYAGLALIIVGIVLIVAEALVPSFGALGIGGIVAFIFGAIMMFDSDIPGFGISVTFVVGLAVVAGLFLLWLVSYLVRLRRRGAVSGRASIIGGSATAMQSFTGEGKVWLEGEAWAAVSKVPVEKDQEVVVRSMDGLTLEVEPASQPDPTEAEFQT